MKIRKNKCIFIGNKKIICIKDCSIDKHILNKEHDKNKFRIEYKGTKIKVTG